MLKLAVSIGIALVLQAIHGQSSYSAEKINWEEIASQLALKDSMTTEANKRRYFIDARGVEKIIRSKKTKFYVISSYGWWCSPCKKQMPQILELKKELGFTLILFNTDKPGDDYYTTRYLKRISYNYPSFTVVANKEYGKGRNRRLRRFIEKICQECDARKFGYGDFILKDSTGKTLFSSTYEDRNPLLSIEKIIEAGL